MTRTTAPFGTWTSPIAAELVAGQSLRFDQVQCAGDTVYWSEGRPAENGRAVIVGYREDGEVFDVIPEPYSARSRVHEYGGGSYLAWDNEVVFVNDGDQAVYHIKDGAPPRMVIQEDGVRFADFTKDPNRARLFAIGEEHGDDPHAPPENMLVEIALDGPEDQASEPLLAGRDFYAAPRFSRDGSHFAWIEWDLPWMPWEESRLMWGPVGEDGGLLEIRHIAGGDGTAVFQPCWGADGLLYFTLDASGWGNIHCWDGETVRPVAEMEAEFSRPMWGLGTTAFAIDAHTSITASYIDGGVFKLGRIAGADGRLAEMPHGFRQFDSIAATRDGVAALATTDVSAPAIVHIPIRGAEPSAPSVLRRATAEDIDAGAIAVGQQIAVPLEGGGETHAIYYPPTNAAFGGEAGTTPPLIAGAHGGPTGMADRGLKLKIQYWTSRGFAFVDVDYRGSAGYGTAYRDALNGQWGLVDVDDVIAASRWLVDQGLADGDRLLISGGSAGGFTVLCALTFHDVFAAGASHYGIGDLGKLLDLTHKFESGYIYNLTGTTAGATDEVFQARSPLFHAERISSPVIFFQGLEDKVVPPGQSREMVEALKGQGIPVAYLEFEGEGHGFRQAETIVAALESEYAFYAEVLGLGPIDGLPDVQIHNKENL